MAMGTQFLPVGLEFDMCASGTDKKRIIPFSKHHS